MGFRLCVINPNSDQSVTSHLRDVALKVLPAGSEVEAVTCTGSPRVIETSTDDVLASVAVLRAALGASSPDAFFVGCFGAPALTALREVTRAPVVGLGESALVQARTVTSRFGLLTTLQRSVPHSGPSSRALGRQDMCAGIRAVSSPHDSPAGAAEAEADHDVSADDADDLARRLDEQGRELVAAGADGLVLACAGFSPMSWRPVRRARGPGL